MVKPSERRVRGGTKLDSLEVAEEVFLFNVSFTGYHLAVFLTLRIREPAR